MVSPPSSFCARNAKELRSSYEPWSAHLEYVSDRLGAIALWGVRSSVSKALEPIAPEELVDRKRTKAGDPKCERGLLALAEHNGNSRKAAEFLARGDTPIHVHHQTLRDWREREPERYERIRAEVVPKVRLRASEQHMELSARLMDAEGELLEQLMDNRHELPPKEVSTALRNVSTSGAIHVDKAQVLSDQPTEIRRLDTGEVLRKLSSRNMRLEATERTVVVESGE